MSKTTIYKTYFHEINSKLAAKNQIVTAKMAPLILQESALVETAESTIIAFLIEYAEVLYGLRPENLSLTLWEAAFTAICERYPGIQVHDIQNAYRYAQIEKRQYTTLTRDELIAPIQEYWLKRMALNREIEEMQQKEQKEIEELKKHQQFKQANKERYLRCLDTGVWDGDEFDAAAIAINFREVFTQEQKNVFAAMAKKEYFDRNEAIEKNQFTKEQSVVPGWTFIFSRIVIEECLKKKMKFICD